MLHNKDVARNLWGEAINTACHTVNRMYFKPGTKKTPYELWKWRKPNVKYFKIFRSTCFILKDRENVGKHSWHRIKANIKHSCKSQLYRNLKWLQWNLSSKGLIMGIKFYVCGLHTHVRTKHTEYLYQLVQEPTFFFFFTYLLFKTLHIKLFSLHYILLKYHFSWFFELFLFFYTQQPPSTLFFHS